MVYHGETYRGDHAPILDRALFEAVQAKLATQAVERRCRVRSSPALLTGRLFDERGNRMSPTHTNKAGVRYSYYLSQAILRKDAAGAATHIPAPELEALVVRTIRRHLQAGAAEPKLIPEADRELVDRYLLRVTLSAKKVMVQIRHEVEHAI